MNRRDVIKALVSGVATVAIGMRVSRGMPAALADGYEYTHQTFKVAQPAGTRYAAALARSMMQTREAVAANVYGRAFTNSGEGARRSVGVEGSPDRI